MIGYALFYVETARQWLGESNHLPLVGFSAFAFLVLARAIFGHARDNGLS